MQKTTSRNIFSYILMFVSIVIIVVVSYFGLKERNKVSQADLLIAQQKKKYEEINKKNELAKELIEYKKTIISKEREAHQRGFYKEGEKVVILKESNTTQDNKDVDQQKNAIKQEYKKPVSIWYEVFFGKSK